MKPHAGPWVRAHLHRRIFLWFGATILFTAIVVGGVLTAIGREERSGLHAELQRAQAFVGGRFARVWESEGERAELARAMARDLDLDLRLVDASGRVVLEVGAPCEKRALRADVVRDGRAIGQVVACTNGRRGTPLARVLLALALAGAVLWAATGLIARRLSRPLAEVAGVARRIGAGDLTARVNLCGPVRSHGEAAALGHALNEMADRVEQKMKDQRALLAAVSHEIRTPLSRIRLLLELSREAGASDPSLDEIDREVIEMDDLVAELLASSRLDFSALSRIAIDGVESARRALDRAALPPSLLTVEAEGGRAPLSADPTLVARALSNLLENARVHGGGLTRLRVRAGEGRVSFEAEDDGPGIPEGDLDRVFLPFHRGTSKPAGVERPSLGLGLALVRRIADAHGGRAYAARRDGGGGARVVLELPTEAPAASTGATPR